MILIIQNMVKGAESAELFYSKFGKRWRILGLLLKREKKSEDKNNPIVQKFIELDNAISEYTCMFVFLKQNNIFSIS